MALDLSNDLSMVDGLEQATLTVRATDAATAAQMLRRPLKRREVEESWGAYLSAFASWHVAIKHLPGVTPVPGDTIDDADEVEWTIVETERLTILGKWRLRTIRLDLVLTETLVLEEHGGQTASGAPDYTPRSVGTVLALVHPMAAEARTRAGQPELEPDYRVVIKPPGFDVTARHTLRRPDGTRLEIVRAEHGRSIQFLQAFICRRITEPD